MKKKIFKMLTIVSICFVLIFGFTHVSTAKAITVNSVTCTYEELENYYNNVYFPIYRFYQGTEPITLNEMLDATSGANMSFTNEQVFNEVMRQMVDYVADDISPYFQSKYDNGKNDGYSSGYSSGEVAGYREGWNKGYEYAYDSAYEEGYAKGEAFGYNEYEAEKGALFQFKDTIFTILDAPFKIIKDALNFEVFGINLSSIVMFILTISIVAFVIKFFI